MRSFRVYIGSGIFLLGGALFLRNRQGYKSHGFIWVFGKSCIELCLILTLAWKIPSLLVCWVVTWLTAPIKNSNIRVTIAVLSGMALASASKNVLEAVLLLSVFAIDRFTSGIIGYWNRAKREEGLV